MKILLRGCLAALGLVSLIVPLRAQESGRLAAAIEKIEQAVTKQMAVDRTPAVSLAFRKDDFLWARGFGYADLENQVLATEKSAYRLASVTKPMTAAAILQLAEQGRIDLDHEVQAYVPYFPRKPWPITIRQLLGHLGGISHYKDPAELRLTESKTTREAIAIFENFELVAEPGTRYNYSSYGYNLLGAVIEGASGMSYGEYMRQHVWEPLGMHDTRLDDPYDLIPHRVRGYQLIAGEIKNSEFVNLSSRFAAGGTRSTVLDMVKFAHGLNSGRLLSPRSLAQMYEAMATRDGHATDYGMGWGTGHNLGHFVVRHSGGQNETRTLLYNDICCNFIVAVACNFEAANPATYASIVVAAVLEEPANIVPYAPDRVSDALLTGMREVFASGLNYFKRFGKPMSENPAALAQAFSYFNQQVSVLALRKDYAVALQKIREGRHPVVQQAFVQLGSFMAARLQERFGAARLEEYHRTGAIPFFYDYISLCRQQPGLPAFHATFVKAVQRWQRDWQRTWTPEVRALALAPRAELAVVQAPLQKLFAGAQVYPSFIGDFQEAILQFILRGEYEKALTAAETGTALYPGSNELLVEQGVVFALFGAKKNGLARIKQAAARDPQGPATAAGLNRLAGQLASHGRLDQGIALLQLAVELYPQNANLYDSLGELHGQKGERQQAIACYRRALEIDPNLQNAKAELEKITKSPSP